MELERFIVSAWVGLLCTREKRRSESAAWVGGDAFAEVMAARAEDLDGFLVDPFDFAKAVAAGGLASWSDAAFAFSSEKPNFVAIWKTSRCLFSMSSVVFSLCICGD